MLRSVKTLYPPGELTWGPGWISVEFWVTTFLPSVDRLTRGLHWPLHETCSANRRGTPHDEIGSPTVSQKGCPMKLMLVLPSKINLDGQTSPTPRLLVNRLIGVLLRDTWKRQFHWFWRSVVECLDIQPRIKGSRFSSQSYPITSISTCPPV
jgi:hypothetical protein